MRDAPSLPLARARSLSLCTWHSSTMTKPWEGLTRSLKTGMYIMSSKSKILSPFSATWIES